MRRAKINHKKLQSSNQHDSNWIKETAECLLGRKVDNLSDTQIRMLRNLYLENLRDGLKHREAMKQANNVVTCFN